MLLRKHDEYFNKLSDIFSHLSSPMVKVTTLFVSKLSGLWRECYRAIYRNYRGAGSTNLFPMIKVTTNMSKTVFLLACSTMSVIGEVRAGKEGDREACGKGKKS